MRTKKAPGYVSGSLFIVGIPKAIHNTAIMAGLLRPGSALNGFPYAGKPSSLPCCDMPRKQEKAKETWFAGLWQNEVGKRHSEKRQQTMSK